MMFATPLLATTGVTKVYPSAAVAEFVPAAAVTITSTKPALSAGAIAVIWDDVLVIFVAGTPPKRTAVAPAKLAPIMVTVLPPAVDPIDGLRPVITGGTYMAVPLKGIVCVTLGLAFKLLSVKMAVPVTGPLITGVGVKAIPTLQAIAGASEKPAVQSAGVPLPVTWEKFVEIPKPGKIAVSGAFPLFAIWKNCTALGEPSFSDPNVRDGGST